MITRSHFISELQESLDNFPVVALVGPRQSGKTTLARSYLRNQSAQAHFFDLEDPPDRARLTAAPRLALENLEGLIVLDEIQWIPDLFPLLRVLADRESAPAKFLVLGSASGDLLRQGSESLAGRIRFLELPGFGLEEVGYDSWRPLWSRGGFPRSFLAPNEKISSEWRDQFIQTFLERDIPNLGIRIPPPQLRRFWQMAAHYHGQIWNTSEIARALGQSDKTMRHYADILSQTFMIRLLPPWFNNMGKRLVKKPKFYFRDSGIQHRLLGLEDFEALQRYPRLGASWEGFALEQVLRMTGEDRNAFFWASHGGAELDLLLPLRGGRVGFEFKYSDAPGITRSMRIAMKELELDRLAVVYPGNRAYPLEEKVDAVPLGDIPQWLTFG